MNLENIKKLCKTKETKKVEFKSSTAHLRAVFETICAFLNGEGGTVLIGVRDDGKIVGQDVSDSTRRDIAKEIKRIEPSVSVDVNYIEVENEKFVIVIQVNSGSYAPYLYDSRAFQRDESETNRMSQHRYEQLLVKRGHLNHSWEELIAENYDVSLLDHNEIYSTVMEGITAKRVAASVAKESIEKILRQLTLATDDGKIKQAAIVLYANEIQTPFTQCWLKMARFKGIDKSGDFIDNQQVYCNVFRMLELGENFLVKHLPISSSFKIDQFKRTDKLALPPLAFREALVNAICHRDYSDRSGYVSIAIFDNRVEVWNNGTLPNKLKLEDLKHSHDSVLRNELIAKIFYLRGYIESWGTGTLKMIELCKEHSIPAPQFSERTGGFVVTFKLAEPMGVGIISKDELTLRQQEILSLLKISPLNSAQIASKLQDSPTVRTVQTDMNRLEALGLIKRKGSARAMLWYLQG